MRILVIVPVYNEWPHLQSVLHGLRRHFPHILVVDDGSDDISFLTALRDEGFDYLRLPFNLGHWAAVQAGFRYALKTGYDGAITFDGDGQHLPEGAIRIRPYVEGGYDVVVGKDNGRGTLPKKLCWWALNHLAGLDIQDFTSGLRGYSRFAMDHLIRGPFLSLHYQDLGVLFMAQKLGFKMIEVHTPMTDRADARSRVFPTIASIISYMFITLTFILVRRP